MACTDPELGKLIGSYELGLLSDEERKRFEDHVLTCDECVKDLYRMAPVVQGMLDDKAVRTKSQGRASRRRNWMLLAASLVVVVVGLYAVVREPAPDERLRGTVEGPVVVFAPVGEVPVPEELDWKIVPPAVSYEVTVQTREGEVIWQQTVAGPPATIPDAVRSDLQPGETYFWQVVAVGEDGTRWSSPPTNFTIWH